MAYNKDIPKATDRIKASQSEILNNFESIDALVKVDHVNFDAASGNQGKHNTVSLPNYVSDPPGTASPVAVADEIKLFTKAVSGITQLFVLPETGEATALDKEERNITYAKRDAKGETKLPSGIRIQWGNDQTPAGGTINVAYNSAFSNVFGIYLTVEESAGGNPGAPDDAFVRVYQFGLANFDVTAWDYSGIAGSRQTAATKFRWFAVGI